MTAFAFAVKRTFRTFLAATWIAALLVAAQAQTGGSTQTGPKKKKPAASRAKQDVKAGGPARKAQAGKQKAGSKPKPSPTPVDPAIEKAAFDAALSSASPSERAALLVKFIADYPKSASLLRAKESLSVARASMADEALTGGEIEKSIGLFKLAVEQAPTPYSDKFFSDVLVVIPANLYFRGQREAGVELAREIETAVASDPKKLLELANFYLSTENGAEARRIAEAAAKLDEKSAAPYLTLGLANRLDFDIEGAAAAFAKALEIDPTSVTAKRSLAEMKRAAGKPTEALAIYRELVAADPNDNVARTGLILTLFDAGEKTEAEAEMAKSLEAVPGNVILLAGAAYWYAANKDGAKAVDLARQAIEKEPRYIWSYIALARGLIEQGKPVDAEQVLVGARKYGNFPTLNFEIASARISAGFFREAAEELEKTFTVEDGTIRTQLGGRIDRGAATFADLLAGERRASIFAPISAEDAQDSARLKLLLEFEQYVSTPKPEESRAVYLAEEFSGGEDNMAVFRKLFSAQLLIDKKVATGKALELAQSAVQYLDRGLSVPNPEAATMASELYDARAASFARNDFLLVPDVPTQTLSALNRGRVEQLSGRALLAEGKAPEAETRFRRALTVYPKDSAWWRAAMWNLGEALEAQGKDEEALRTMITTYKIDKPDAGRYLSIQFLYKKVKGSLDGFEAAVGPNPFDKVVAANTTTAPSATETPAAQPTPPPAPTETSATPEPTGTASVEASPSPSPSSSPTPAENVIVETTPTQTPTVSPTPTAEVSPTLEPSSPAQPPGAPANPQASPTPEPSPVSSPNASAERVPVETAKTDARPLFDPIVIPIGKTTPEVKAPTVPEVSGDQTAATPSGSPVDKDKPVASSASSDDEKTDGSATPAASPETRPRIVEGKEVSSDNSEQPCTITATQEKVSILNNGGSIALIVSFPGTADKLASVSSSPKDIEVHSEPDIISVPGRQLFVIRSISEKTGMYEVTFAAACGKTKVLVQVR